MKLDDLVLQNKLVDVNTGEIIGYTLISDTGCIIALTKSKILELGMDLANYIDYTDAISLEVLSYNNYYARTENILYKLDEYEETPYRLLKDKVCLWGSVINRYHLMELDNEQAINNIMKDEEFK